MNHGARDLVDRYWGYHTEADDRRPLWDSDMEYVERWPSTSVLVTDERRRRLLEFRDEALVLLDDADTDDVPTLRTVADSALLLAAKQDVETELMYPHPRIGLHSYLFWAVNNFPLRTADDGQRYLEKLAGLPAAIDEFCERLEHAAAAGRAPLARHSREAIEHLDRHLATSTNTDPLMDQAAPTDVDRVSAERWRDDLAGAIEEHVRPALALLRDTLRGVSLPAGRDDAHCGLMHQPDGAATYARLVEAFTVQGRTPGEVHDTGREQVERLAGEYRDLGSSALGTTDVVEIFRRLREDPALHHTQAHTVVEAATRLHARAQEVAPAWFLRTPEARCEVRAVEHGAVAFYSRPAADGSRPGVFFFNTSDPTIWGPQLAATVFHEGIPGHHFQLALALEDATLHDLHRNLYLPAFGEGWGLYAERLADQMGLYASDIDRLGMLASDSLRACRLVVDTGIHALGWGRQQAIDYMLDNSPLNVVEVSAEVDRYIAMPGQATSYMMGRLEIERLRNDAMARLGDVFDMRSFHDLVLSRGMVSLAALRTMIAAWVDEIH